MPLKAVLLDFGGTLDDDGTPWLERFHPLYARHGVDVPLEAFRRAFYDSDDSLARRFPLAGLSLEETARLQVSCVLERLAPERAALAAPIAREFAARARERLRANRPLLERLRRRFKLGVVSNFYGNLEGLLAAEGLALFDAVADSGRVGALKPEPALFLHAVNALGVAAGDCLMVGDSLARDMRGAEALGMPHAWLRPGGKDASCCPGAPRLERLGELEALLEREAARA